MLQERGKISNDLPCYLCGKSTPTGQLKITGEGNWICSICAQRIFKRHSKPSLDVKEEKKDIPAFHFDLEEKELENTSFTSSKKIESQFIAQKLNQSVLTSSRFGEKELYKCTHCTFESRHYRNDEICPNCGKKDRLAKIPQASELVDELKKRSL